jgi:hypothetical protein
VNTLTLGLQRANACKESTYNQKLALAVDPAVAVRFIRTTFAWKPGEYREIRALGKGIAPLHAVAGSPEEAVEAISRISAGVNVFLTLNPVKDGAPAREGGRFPKSGGPGTRDCDIARRTRFVIDLDPIRGSDTSSTDAELTMARKLAGTIIDDLVERQGWPRPTVVMSGNGLHLYWSIDLPAESDLVPRALRGLSARFSNEQVRVDTSVGNPARIMRVPGTLTAKGDDPTLYRVATVEVDGDETLLAAEQLESVAERPTPPREEPPTDKVYGEFDLQAWLDRHDIRPTSTKPWPAGGTGAKIHVLLACEFNPAHNRGEAVITEQASGALGYTCHHDSCQGKGWKEFRASVESRYRVESDPGDTRVPFPVDALPMLLQQATHVQSRTIGTDPAVTAISLLVASAGIVGNGVRVAIHPAWDEAVGLWAMIVAPSGSMKSSAIRVISELTRTVESKLKLPDPDKPELRERITTSDPTVEALGVLAAQNPRGLLILNDELSGFVDAIGQYKKGGNGDTAFYLAATEGMGHRIDRKTTASVDVPRLLCSMLGTIQPKVAKRVLSQEERANNGFTARFLVVYPSREPLEFRIPTEAEDQALAKMKGDLLQAWLSFRSIPMPHGEPSILRFDAEATRLIIHFANEQSELSFLLADESVERASRDKARGWVARIAGIFALYGRYERHQARTSDFWAGDVDYSKATVTTDEVQRAIRVVEWLLQEKRRLLQDAGMDERELDLRRLDELARKAMTPNCGFVTAREVQRKLNLKSVAKAERILEELEKAGRWKREFTQPGPTGGAPSCRYAPVR